MPRVPTTTTEISRRHLCQLIGLAAAGSLLPSCLRSRPTREPTNVTPSNISTLLAGVDRARITSDIRALSSGSRHFASPHLAEAVQYIKNELRIIGERGGRIEEQLFPLEGESAAQRGESSNIIATLPGVSKAGKKVVFMAHYDAMANNEERAYGADDNASGVACLLELARIISHSNIKLPFDIEFVFTGAEEATPPCQGSKSYLKANPTDQIIGVFNFDTLGYNPISDRLMIHTNLQSSFLAEAALRANQRFGLALELDRLEQPMLLGDHSPCWQAGLPAVGLHENGGPFRSHRYPGNEFYHSPADGPAKLNYGLIEKAAKLGCALLFELAAQSQFPAHFDPRQIQYPSYLAVSYEGMQESETSRALVLTHSTYDGRLIEFSIPQEFLTQHQFDRNTLRFILACATQAYNKLFAEWNFGGEEIKRFVSGPDNLIKIRVADFFGTIHVKREEGDLILEITPETIVSGRSGHFEFIMLHEFFHFVQNAYRAKHNQVGDVDFAGWYFEGMAQFVHMLLDLPAAQTDTTKGNFFEVTRGLMRSADPSFYWPPMEDREAIFINDRGYLPLHAYTLLWFLVYKHNGGMAIFRELVDVISQAGNSCYDQFSQAPSLITEVLQRGSGGYRSLAEVIWGNPSTMGLAEAMYRRDFRLEGLDFGSDLETVRTQKISLSSGPFQESSLVGSYGFKYYEIISDGNPFRVEVSDKSAAERSGTDLGVKIIRLEENGSIAEIEAIPVDQLTRNAEIEISAPQRGERYVVIVGNLGHETFSRQPLSETSEDLVPWRGLNCELKVTPQQLF